MPEPKKPEQETKPRRRVKKVKGHGGHHGGAWKVAYADFVTAMMALFLVLWLVSQADTKLKQEIASYFRSPGIFDSTAGGILPHAKKVSNTPEALTAEADSQALFSVAETLKKKFGSRAEFSKYKDQVKIQVTDEGLKIEILDKAEQVSFASGSADLNDEARKIIAEIARPICELPNKINIGGHTDKHVFAENSDYTNWELSADRANAARRALESECVKPAQIHRITGYADTDPLVSDDPFAPANRRISITVLRLNENELKGAATSNEEAKEKPAVSTEKPKSPAPEKSKTKVRESEAIATNDQTEKQKAKLALQKQGKISVGAPDEIPAAKILKESENPKH